MAKHKYELLAGQVTTLDRTKPIKDADDKVIPGRYERKTVSRGGFIESNDPNLASKEPERYRLVAGGDQAAEIARLREEIARLEAQQSQTQAGVPQAVDNPSVAPGGQVSTGFQKSTATGSAPMTAEDLERQKARTEANAGRESKGDHATTSQEHEPDFDAMTVPEMKAHAEEHHIELHGATSRTDVLKAVKAHRRAK